MEDFAAFHHDVRVGKFFCKIVELVDQQNRHRFAFSEQRQYSANILDEAGLNAFGRLAEDEQFGVRR